MKMKICDLEIPKDVEIAQKLTSEEHRANNKNINRNIKTMDRINSGFHEKNAKNQQVNDRDRWRKERAIKYKKPKTRGDKGANLRRK
jgi:ATP-dependent RNA helicase RhlE